MICITFLRIWGSVHDVVTKGPHDALRGGEDNDRWFGQDGDDVMGGWTGDDTMFGGAVSDLMVGFDGNDIISAIRETIFSGRVEGAPVCAENLVRLIW